MSNWVASAEMKINVIDRTDVATNIFKHGFSNELLILKPNDLDRWYNKAAIIQLDIVVLTTGDRYPRKLIRERATSKFPNIEITAILNGVEVSPFEKKIGVKILCRIKAGRPSA